MDPIDKEMVKARQNKPQPTVEKAHSPNKIKINQPSK